MRETHTPPDADVIERGHEADTVNSRLLIVSGVGLVLLVVFALLFMHLMGAYLNRDQAKNGERQQAVRSTPARTGVRVTADQPRQLRELRQSEEQRLNRYEWIVEPEGIGRIPIERAMEIIAKNGLPTPKPNTEEQDDNTD